MARGFPRVKLLVIKKLFLESLLPEGASGSLTQPGVCEPLALTG